MLLLAFLLSLIASILFYVSMNKYEYDVVGKSYFHYLLSPKLSPAQPMTLSASACLILDSTCKMLAFVVLLTNILLIEIYYFGLLSRKLYFLFLSKLFHNYQGYFYLSYYCLPALIG